MRSRSIATATAVLLAVSACSRPTPAVEDIAGSVSGGGVTLVSTSVTLPDDTTHFSGPGADLMEANCSGCHSASMVLSQPPLKPEQWKAEVTKMREVYKAPVADKDVPAILAYLSATRARPAGEATPH